MNKPIFYIPFTLFTIFSVVLLALEIPHYGLASGVSALFYLSFVLCTLITVTIYYLYRYRLDGDNLYKLVASTFLFSFVVLIAWSSYMNRAMATSQCSTENYEVLGYQARFASAYGKSEKVPKPNQWIILIKKDGEDRKFVLDKDLFEGKEEQEFIGLEFCEGWFHSEYLKLN